MQSNDHTLKASAGSALIWGVAFTLGRDIVQFGSMLLLVRLLSPEIYGQFALAQTIQIFLAVLSLKAIAPFALQARDPNEFDWNLQFTVGAILNSAIFVITLLIAAGIYALASTDWKVIGLVLAVMAAVLPLEIFGTHYFTWLQAHHQWKRMRLLLILGSLLGSGVAIALALLGAGVFALAAGNICFAVPLIADYFFRRPFSVRLDVGRIHQYKEGIAFGGNRVVSGALQSGCGFAEQAILAGVFGFSILGIYTRAIGLAQITSGRIGPVVVQTLYPVLTRAEPSSERFRRFGGILFQGVVWTSAPAAMFLALRADNIVLLLYGDQWTEVVPLMRAAAALLALRGLHLTVNQIMLANLQQRACLRLDLAASVTMFGVIFSAATYGPKVYMIALGLHAALVLFATLWVASRGGAICGCSAISRLISCGGALAVSAAALLLLPTIFEGPNGLLGIFMQLAVQGGIFLAAYVGALRLFAPRSLSSLFEALPVPIRVRNIIAAISLTSNSSRSTKS